VQITLSLILPRDGRSVPIARHIAATALREAGVDDDCINDTEVALSEACTNVLRHSGPGDEYEVAADVDEERCTIRVVDTGRGFDSESLGGGHATPSSEQGRGLELMRALVDRAQFVSHPEEGTVVSLEKSLTLRPGSLLTARPQSQ
jgi:serine/threonine-protein kinase RsbW